MASRHPPSVFDTPRVDADRQIASRPRGTSIALRRPVQTQAHNHLEIPTLRQATTLTKTQLRKRGWTESGIRKFLGPPDRTRRNTRYRSASPICLYSKARVEVVEQTEEFKTWLDGRVVRGERSRKIVERRSAKLLAEVDSWRPALPRLSEETLKQRALADYERLRFRHRRRRRSYNSLFEPMDDQMLKRIMVNYLRHRTTDYDRVLDLLSGRMGVVAATAFVRTRVYEAISTMYPNLAEESNRQLARRVGRNVTGKYGPRAADSAPLRLQ